MKRWTNEELEVLISFYNKIDPKKTENISFEIAKHINRTPKQIRQKAYELCLTKSKKYTIEEINFLKEKYNLIPAREISKILNRSVDNLSRKAKELGLERKRLINNPNEVKIKIVRHQRYETDEIREKVFKERSERAKEWHRNNGHPRGMLNKHHSIEAKKRISKGNIEGWLRMTETQLKNRKAKSRITRIKNNTLNPISKIDNCYSRARGGRREDLNNVYFRSSWEANIARYYNFTNIKWQFEPKIFVFDKIKKGSVSYTPDFYLPELDKWIEVKGWMDNKSKTKLKRFEKYYPEEYKKLELINDKKYYEIKKKISCFIPKWEY